MESVLDICAPFAIYRDMESWLSIERRRTVKNRLEEIRKERGIKQEELAAALEVSRQTIGSLETDDTILQLHWRLSLHGILI